MLGISLDTQDPFFNLALEEVLLKNSNEEYFIIGINDPCVVIGKHQVAHREVNTRFITEQRIPVIRRISGGGTVFHDTGNLNFTFIRQSEEGRQIDFIKHTRPVIDYLISLGVDAKFEGKNNIAVDGLKISGNAEHIHRNRVLHHGTLLFNASIERLGSTIRSDKSSYTTRAVDSNPAPVANLKDQVKGFANIYLFKRSLMNYVSGVIPDFKEYFVSSPEGELASALAEKRYKTWEWNYAYGPAYIFTHDFLFEDEPHTCTISVNEGRVSDCVILGSQPMSRLAQILPGRRHMVEEFMEIINKDNIGIPDEEIYNFF